ncbi:MAG: molybdopterin-binding protein [Bacteroidetes bacterium]|nr:molybdopterin-binding protein [Bacteroidota bacterium]
MKRLIFLLGVVCGGFGVLAQKPDPTKSFTVSGEVRNPKQVSIQDFSSYRSFDIGNVVITNHLGEKKIDAVGLKGILLKDALASVELNAELPKDLSTFYFVCKAVDGYSVVFSWNELFNNPAGESIYIVTEKNGQSVDKMPDAILLLSPKDFKTGRRHVKSLESIDVRRVR